MESQEEEVAEVVSRTVILDSPPVQKSPFLNYLNNLSPITPAKATNATRVFPRIYSSPLVFASPTVKLQPRTDHSKRTKMFGFTNEEHSQNVRKDDLSDSSPQSKKLVTLSGIGLDCVNEESSNSKDMLRVQSCSSSGIADGFLADPFEADCANSTHLSDQNGNCSRSTSDFCYERDSTKGFGREDTDVQLVSPKQSNADAEKLFTYDGPTVEAEEYHDTYPSFSVICDVAMGDLSVDDSENQVDIGPVSDRNKEGCHLGESSSHVQPLYGPLQDPGANENHGQDASESLRLLDDTHHREGQSYNVTSPGSLAMGELEKVDPSEVTSTYMKTSVSTVKAVIIGRDGKSSAVTPNKPSGIGLHLNSIISARSINSRETIHMKHDKDNQGGRDLKPAGAGTGNMFDKPTDFPFSVEPHNFSNVQELYGTPLDKKTLQMGFADAEFTQTNAKRRRKASNTSDTDGCKRCSCKKSRCLKLYCDCFASGLFCTDPCACQGCLNRFEEQDTVLAVRELIESCNPLGFAPKIVHTNKGFDASNGEDGICPSSSSARHKIGCNCKRSMCQKKYCECYKANVGCSDNCRCEGCRNVFRTKEDFLVARELARGIVDEASLEGMSVMKLAMVATYSRDLLMPPTPSFHFSDNRKDLQRSKHLIECLSPSSSVKSGAACWSSEMQSEGSKESPTLVTITDFTDPDCSKKVDEFSPKHDSLGSSSHLPPVIGGVHPPSRFLWKLGSLETPGIVSGGENSHQDDKPASKVYEILDDDTPGVSKDVHLPTKPVIISSPSRKRVSSPHKQIRGRRLTSSTALRSGASGSEDLQETRAPHIRSDPETGTDKDEHIGTHVNAD